MRSRHLALVLLAGCLLVASTFASSRKLSEGTIAAAPQDVSAGLDSTSSGSGVTVAAEGQDKDHHASSGSESRDYSYYGRVRHTRRHRRSSRTDKDSDYYKPDKESSYDRDSDYYKSDKDYKEHSSDTYKPADKPDTPKHGGHKPWGSSNEKEDKELQYASDYYSAYGSQPFCKKVVLEEEEFEVEFDPEHDRATITTVMGTCSNSYHPVPTLGGGCSVECEVEDDLIKLTPLASHTYAAPALFKPAEEYYPVMCSYRADAPLHGPCMVVMKVACCSDMSSHHWDQEEDEEEEEGKGQDKEFTDKSDEPKKRKYEKDGKKDDKDGKKDDKDGKQDDQDGKEDEGDRYYSKDKEEKKRSHADDEDKVKDDKEKYGADSKERYERQQYRKYVQHEQQRFLFHKNVAAANADLPGHAMKAKGDTGKENQEKEKEGADEGYYAVMKSKLLRIPLEHPSHYHRSLEHKEHP